MYSSNFLEKDAYIESKNSLDFIVESLEQSVNVALLRSKSNDKQNFISYNTRNSDNKLKSFLNEILIDLENPSIDVRDLMSLSRDINSVYGRFIDIYSLTASSRDYKINFYGLDKTFNDCKNIMKLGASIVLNAYENSNLKSELVESRINVERELSKILPSQDDLSRINIDLDVVLSNIKDIEKTKDVRERLFAIYFSNVVYSKYDSVESAIIDLGSLFMSNYEISELTKSLIVNLSNSDLKNEVIKIGQKYEKNTIEIDNNTEINLKSEVREKLRNELLSRFDTSKKYNLNSYQIQTANIIKNYFLELVSRDELVEYVIDKKEVDNAFQRIQSESIDHIVENYINPKIMEKMTDRFSTIYSEIIKNMEGRSTEEFINSLYRLSEKVSERSKGLKKIISNVTNIVGMKTTSYSLKYTSPDSNSISPNKDNVRTQYQRREEKSSIVNRPSLETKIDYGVKQEVKSKESEYDSLMKESTQKEQSNIISKNQVLDTSKNLNLDSRIDANPSEKIPNEQKEIFDEKYVSQQQFYNNSYGKVKTSINNSFKKKVSRIYNSFGNVIPETPYNTFEAFAWVIKNTKK